MSAISGATGLPLIEARDLTVRHRRRGGWSGPSGWTTALDGVSLSLRRGEALAIVGESGSGKSTLARSLLRLHRPTTGQVLLEGTDLSILTAAELRERRRSLQMVFQDPLASLDPLFSVQEIIAEPLRAARPDMDEREVRTRVAAQLTDVGLGEEYQSRHPRQLSGGQAQRIAIARALVTQPMLLVCDEPVSALDASLRAQILDLLDAQRRRRNLALLFVTHDLAAARYLCERTLVLRSGKVVEQGATRALFEDPQQPYTRELLGSMLSVAV